MGGVWKNGHPYAPTPLPGRKAGRAEQASPHTPPPLRQEQQVGDGACPHALTPFPQQKGWGDRSGLQAKGMGKGPHLSWQPLFPQPCPPTQKFGPIQFSCPSYATDKLRTIEFVQGARLAFPFVPLPTFHERGGVDTWQGRPHSAESETASMGGAARVSCLVR